ncbi:NB-ARC domain-containing protein [Actinosynnema sp. NPDC050436]|uniref:NB-ARC domain-containing protein n=1 Tax=Actinosynnema sp. NPDC050436 TaxID=3155659 RepID=UPI0033F0A015
MQGFLHALGVDHAAVPLHLDAQASLFRSLTAGRRVLVVLDNAADTAQVTPLLPGGNCTTLVTSRHRLTALVTTRGAEQVLVEALPDDEARVLLRERIGAGRVAAEPGAADDLVAYCAGLPLALSVVAGRARARPSFSLASFSAQPADAATRLGELDDDDLASVRTVLSWSTSVLTDEQARMFGLLGTAPGPDLSAASAACLADLTTQQATTILRTLERASLLQEHEPGRYRMYDLVRLHAAELDAGPGERKASVTRLVTMHLYTSESIAGKLWPYRRPSLPGPVQPGRHTVVPATAEEAWAWFHAEQRCLRATVQAAADTGLHRHVWQLARHLGPLFDRAGSLQAMTGWALTTCARSTRRCRSARCSCSARGRRWSSTWHRSPSGGAHWHRRWTAS